MSNLNTVLLSGRLARDPELRHTRTEHRVCRFTLANQGPAQQKVNWLDIAAWDRLGDFIYEYAQKGTYVNLVCRILQVSYKDSSGKPRYKLELVADTAEITAGWKPRPGQSPDRKADEEALRMADEYAPPDFSELPDREEDLPF